MNETTKYLSAKAVSDLKEEMRNAKNIHDTLDLKDASISARLISNFEAEHFAVQIGNEKINCRKANSTEIRKVTAGVFKGLFALIEHEGQKVNVYLIYPKGYIFIVIFCFLSWWKVNRCLDIFSKIYMCALYDLIVYILQLVCQFFYCPSQRSFSRYFIQFYPLLPSNR